VYSNVTCGVWEHSELVVALKLRGFLYGGHRPWQGVKVLSF
jgi:hypothetical protein